MLLSTCQPSVQNSLGVELSGFRVGEMDQITFKGVCPQPYPSNAIGRGGKHLTLKQLLCPACEVFHQRSLLIVHVVKTF